MAQEPERPSEREVEPERPSEREVEPERPSEREVEPERPPEREVAPKRPSEREMEPPRYAERMFPAPVDPGIAEPDRAVCSVPFGTSSYLEGAGGEGGQWFEGGGATGERAVAEIVVYPPTGGVQTQG